MKNILMNAATRFLAVVAVAALALFATWRAANAQPTDGERGKVYMLTVWTGTSFDATEETHNPSDMSKNNDFRLMIENSRKVLDGGLFNTLTMSDGNGDNIIHESLTGEKTNPQEIVDKIYELSEAANEEDALFVYIVSHGWALDPEMQYGEKRADGVNVGDDREHLIVPLVKGAAPDFTQEAITRANLLYYMRSKKHRLNVLITDSCSSSMLQEKLIRETKVAPSLGASSNVFPALRYLLTHAEGTISWNSTNPCSFWQVKQDALIQTDESQPIPDLSQPLKVSQLQEVRDDSSYREVSLGDSDRGTVFARAFWRAALGWVPAGYTFDDFFLDLGATYDEEYQKYWTFMMSDENAIKQYGGLNSWQGAYQGRTTLTQFNVEEDHSGNPKKDNDVVVKTNNRVLKPYIHEDDSKGSGKSNITASLGYVYELVKPDGE